MVTRNTMKTHIIDVGHGDTTIIEFPNTKALGIIDCFKYAKISNFIFNELQPEEIQFILATHPHQDHIAGILPLIQSCEKKNIPLNLFLQSGYFIKTGVYRELVKYLSKKGYLRIQVRAGFEIPHMKQVKLRVLSPPSELITKSASDCNNSSVVLHAKYGRSKILLSGDAEYANWAHLFVGQRDWLRAQVLKLSHHGSKHGTFFELLQTIRPQYAIISGPSNKKFPHPLIELILNTDPNLRVFQTHIHGNITIESKINGIHQIITGKEQ